jgi:methionyl-tRNA formyltransferase
VAGALTAEPQRDEEASYAPPLERVDSVIDWQRSARTIHDQVRGLAPRPGAHTSLGNKKLKILKARCWSSSPPLEPGRVRVTPAHELQVGTSDGVLEVLIAQLVGRKALEARALLNGRTVADGTLLGE